MPARCRPTGQGFQEAVRRHDLRGASRHRFFRTRGYQKFQESGIWKDKCYKYIEYVVEKLYELDDGKGKDPAGP